MLSLDNNLTVSTVSVISNQVQSGSTITGGGGGLYQGNGGTLSLRGRTPNSEQLRGQRRRHVRFEHSECRRDEDRHEHGDRERPRDLLIDERGVAQPDECELAGSNHIAATGVASGGGLYVVGGTLNTNGLMVKGNSIQASGNNTIQGGGIYASGTTINLNGGTSASSTFTGNLLTGNGGGAAYGGASSSRTDR